METLKTLIWVLQMVSALIIVLLVLLQHGKGADAGATLGAGGGSSGSLFGASGSSNFLSKSTAWVAVVFFVTTFSLVLLSHLGNSGGIMANMNGKVVASQTVPESSVASAPVSSAPLSASGTVNQMPN